MSATNRGKARIANDYYPTPPWCTFRLLDAAARELGLLRHSPRVLEPSVGDGAIVRAVETWRKAHRSAIGYASRFEGDVREVDDRAFVSAEQVVRWTTCELRRSTLSFDVAPASLEHFEGVDFRGWVPPHRFDLSLGNPPFEFAERFVRHSQTMATLTCMLLRLGFLGSDERADWLRANPPALRVLPDRPSFDGGGTDSDYYAWMIWPGVDVEFVELPSFRSDVRILGSTPATIRALQKPITPSNLPQTELDL